MGEPISKFRVGSEEYPLEAESLLTPAGIDGVAFDGGESITHFGVCSTAAGTAAKTVTIGGEFTLETGAEIRVKFTYANTAANPTLNVSGTGAMPISLYGETSAGSAAWAAGETLALVFDGARWQIVMGGVYQQLAGKQNTLTFDDDPTAGSSNPVKSGGVYAQLALKAPLDSPAFTGTPNAPTAASGTDTTQIASTAFVQQEISSIENYALGAYPTESASGETAPTAVGADDVPLKSLVVNIALKVYGSGTPSPTNIRRFAAFDKAVISQMDGTGEWQTDASAAIVRQPQNYVGAIGDTATFTVVAIGATAYRWQFNSGSGWQNSSTSTEGYNEATLKPVINAARLGYLYRCRVNTASGYLYSAPVQMVETGTTPADLSAYVDYIPDYAPLVTVDWSSIAGTICARATLDVLSGILTTDSYYKALDGTEDWRTVSGTGGNPDYYYWIAPQSATLISSSARFCSHFDYAGDIASGNARIGWRFNSENNRVMVRPGIDSIETVDDWTDWLKEQAQASTPVQIYLAATEPRTYQLDTNEVKSLLGDNTIRANAGNVDVIYRCDPTLYIDAKLSAIGG